MNRKGRIGRLAAGGALSCVAAIWASGASAQSIQDLQGMSIDQLADLQVTSVSKRPESLGNAASAIYVITHDEIIRSGARSLPEILRLAPNLQVAAITASSYAISARGFNGNAADKLLVLIDGRSVYTPLFGGVLWDEQAVPPENIERIEVISGPGATLWGANAVNGVINIITRDSADTQGGLVDVRAGNRDAYGTLQYGGKLGRDWSYRAYLDGSRVRGDHLSTGAKAHNGWRKGEGGFRLDWAPQGKADRVTIEGALYRASEDQGAMPDLDLSGGHVQASWQHKLAGDSTLQVLAYYDRAERVGVYSLDTWDAEFQHSFMAGAHAIVWGGGVRLYHDRFSNAGLVSYLPATGTQTLADIFAQDTIAVAPSLDVTLGAKLEKDPYSGATVLPTVRAGWKIADDALIWAAVSRAVRAPTLFDQKLHDTLVPGVLILTGNKDFRTEKLTAYQVGARIQLSSAASFSVSTFYDVYDDLLSVEWRRMDSLPLLLSWGNMMEGNIYGLEAWGDYQASPRWRLTAGFNVQHEDLRFKPGAGSANSIAAAGNDPDVQASLRSTLALSDRLHWYAALRYVGRLPDPHVPAYTELDTSLTFDVTPRLALSIVGSNLLHHRHLEYEEAGATIGNEVDRNVSAGLRLRF